jgi:hypothetical protein
MPSTLVLLAGQRQRPSWTSQDAQRSANINIPFITVPNETNQPGLLRACAWVSNASPSGRGQPEELRVQTIAWQCIN